MYRFDYKLYIIVGIKFILFSALKELQIHCGPMFFLLFEDL